jgi:hypothetical protein
MKRVGTFVLYEPAGGGDQLGAGGCLPNGKLQPADPRLHRQRQGPACRDSHAALGLWAAVFMPPLYIALVILHAKQAGTSENLAAMHAETQYSLAATCGMDGITHAATKDHSTTHNSDADIGFDK